MDENNMRGIITYKNVVARGTSKSKEAAANSFHYEEACVNEGEALRNLNIKETKFGEYECPEFILSEMEEKRRES